MSKRTKAAALALLLTTATGLYADAAPLPSGVQVLYQGYKAERLFINLSDLLLRETIQLEGREIRRKTGFALGCEEVRIHATQQVEYTCAQHFFKDGRTSNADLIRSIPVPPAGLEKTYSELILTGENAARVFALAAATFSDEVELCPVNQTCDYQRVVRAKDITCFERKGANESLQYDCAQYIQNLRGIAIPGGGDPMIGVVL